jgi:hypothetical protein
MNVLKACECKYGPRTPILRGHWDGGTVAICSLCACYCALGPSDETPVAVEVRAAEIAVDAADRGETRWITCHPYEWYGWLEHKNGTAAGIDGDEFQTGYLARVIHEHDLTGAQ